jgi:hypothetical protein
MDINIIIQNMRDLDILVDGKNVRMQENHSTNTSKSTSNPDPMVFVDAENVSASKENQIINSDSIEFPLPQTDVFRAVEFPPHPRQRQPNKTYWSTAESIFAWSNRRPSQNIVRERKRSSLVFAVERTSTPVNGYRFSREPRRKSSDYHRNSVFSFENGQLLGSQLEPDNHQSRRESIETIRNDNSDEEPQEAPGSEPQVDPSPDGRQSNSFPPPKILRTNQIRQFPAPAFANKGRNKAERPHMQLQAKNFPLNFQSGQTSTSPLLIPLPALILFGSALCVGLALVSPHRCGTIIPIDSMPPLYDFAGGADRPRGAAGVGSVARRRACGPRHPGVDVARGRAAGPARSRRRLGRRPAPRC